MNIDLIISFRKCDFLGDFRVKGIEPFALELILGVPKVRSSYFMHSNF